MSDERDYQTLAEAAVYDETGGSRCGEPGHRLHPGLAGSRRAHPLGDSGWDHQQFRTNRYVKLTGKKPVLADRPVLAGVPEAPSVPVSTEVSIPRVPACTVTFEGP